ncbi:MAG: hypothetical protein AAF585_02705, partial [Verrucomicrobiota bacterium]
LKGAPPINDKSDLRTPWLHTAWVFFLIPLSIQAGMTGNIAFVGGFFGFGAAIFVNILCRFDTSLAATFGIISGLTSTTAVDLSSSATAGMGAISGASSIIVAAIFKNRVIDPIAAISAFGVGGFVGAVFPAFMAVELSLATQALGATIAILLSGATWFAIGFALPTKSKAL